MLKAEELDCILYQNESSTRLLGSTALVLVKDLTCSEEFTCMIRRFPKFNARG